MNPRLPSEVTYKWKNMLLRCTKPNILQDRASKLGSGLEELQTWQSLKMWQSPVLAGSCFSSVENLSLWIRGKCIMLSDVCFREPFWMARVAPCDVPWVHPESFTLLPRADFRISVLFLSFPFHMIKLVFSKYKDGGRDKVPIFGNSEYY